MALPMADSTDSTLAVKKADLWVVLSVVQSAGLKAEMKADSRDVTLVALWVNWSAVLRAGKTAPTTAASKAVWSAKWLAVWWDIQWVIR